jgi:hypothetical protein
MNLNLPLASRLPCLLIIQTFFVMLEGGVRTKQTLTISTQEIMKIGLDLVNWTRIPSDSTIHVAARNNKSFDYSRRDYR